jgi:hypothetical protein
MFSVPAWRREDILLFSPWFYLLQGCLPGAQNDLVPDNLLRTFAIKISSFSTTQAEE